MALPHTEALLACLKRSPEYNPNSGTFAVDAHTPKLLSITMKNILLELRRPVNVARKVSMEMERILNCRVGTEVEAHHIAVLFASITQQMEKKYGFEGMHQSLRKA